MEVAHREAVSSSRYVFRQHDLLHAYLYCCSQLLYLLPCHLDYLLSKYILPTCLPYGTEARSSVRTMQLDAADPYATCPSLACTLPDLLPHTVPTHSSWLLLIRRG